MASINKRQIETRLMSEGRWSEFRKIREDIRRTQGLNGADVWLAALDVKDKHGYPFSYAYPQGITLENAIPRGPGEDLPKPPTPISDAAAAFNGRKAANPFRATKAAFAGKPKATHRQNVEWVAENIRVEDVKPEEAPSATAWSMLCFVRSGMGGEEEKFWTALYAKLMPSQAEMKYFDKMSDSGSETRDALKVCEEAEQAMRESEKEAATLTPAQQPERKPEDLW